MNVHTSETFSFAVLFFIVGALLYFIFAPFLQAVMFAAVLAIFFHKPYRSLVHGFFGSRSTAALICTFIVLLFLIIPLLFLGWRIFIEAGNLLASLQYSEAPFLQMLQTMVARPLQHIAPGLAFDSSSIVQYLKSVVTFVTANLGVLVTGTFSVILQIFLMLLAFYFFLRDGESFVKKLKTLSPLREEHTLSLFTHTQDAVESILKGTILVALIRWVFISAGFYFFGIHNAVLWGSMGGIVGAIPGLGTLLVFALAVSYLYLAGHVAAAVGLASLGMIVIVLVDNILTAYFFGKGLEDIPSVFVLFSILGGVIFFGPLGFVFGPLVLAIFLSLLHIYSKAARDRRAKK
jgi:predicted PurR-regulated permease PerM